MGAAGNEGQKHQHGSTNDIGYYSIWRVNKNEINVANLSDLDLRWAGSSLGPTLDGRIKPDIAAPGSRPLFPSRSEVIMEIDSITLSGTTPITWDFNGSQEGWGASVPGYSGTWLTKRNIGAVTILSGILTAPILSPPYGKYWENRPKLGTLQEPDGTFLNIPTGAEDTIEIRYRLEPVALWNTDSSVFVFGWDPAPLDWDKTTTPFPVVADGQWHTQTINVGNIPEWTGNIVHLYVQMSGPRMKVPSINNNAYTAASGSSAAAPVVAGATVLLMDQLQQDFGVVLTDKFPLKSPFWFEGPGTAVPYPSTFKAILLHTARDLAYISRPFELDNPDTDAPTVYHKGPDYVTGYGIVDIAEANRLVSEHSAIIPYIIEDELNSSVEKTYTFTLPAIQLQPLKITLVWDDPPATKLTPTSTCKLLNDLDLLVTDPNGVEHRPWSLDLPTYNLNIGLTDPNDITPARQDLDDDCNNVEQVYVETPTRASGDWIVEISAESWG